MIIYVNGIPASIKEGTAFDYTVENPLFLGRESYTLNITFPTRGSRNNAAIFGHISRADVRKRNVSYPCRIVDKDITIVGFLFVVKVNENSVECQFAVGRSADSMKNPLDDFKINQLDLGSPAQILPSAISPAQAWADSRDCIAIPWINESYPEAPNNWVTKSGSTYSWDEDVSGLSWFPRLSFIAKQICSAIGYDYDFTAWDNSPKSKLFMFNTLPASWGSQPYARSLPDWTVAEFFEKLETFLMAEFSFDHAAKSVAMAFSADIIDSTTQVALPNVVDSYTTEISTPDNSTDNCDYIATRRLAYRDGSSSIWAYYSCDWILPRATRVTIYPTLSELLAKNKFHPSAENATDPREMWGEPSPWFTRGRFRTTQELLFAEDVNTHFCFRPIGELYFEQHYGETFLVKRKVTIPDYVLQPVNVFGAGSVESDDVDTEEIDFIPASIIDTHVSADDDRGYMLSLSFSDDESPSDSDYMAGNRPDGEDSTSSKEVIIDHIGVSQSIEAGESSSSSDFFDYINVGFWDSSAVASIGLPLPIIDNVFITQDWRHVALNPAYSLRLHSRSDGSPTFTDLLPAIDPSQKFTFTWLGSTIPNPRAIFNIRGQLYVCAKITATFTEDGMSQLLKGEFYQLSE